MLPQVRDARVDNLPLLRTLDGFCLSDTPQGAGLMRRVGGLLTAAGHGIGAVANQNHADSRRAAVWRLDGDTETLETVLELPTTNVHSVSIRGDARRLAVGTDDGVVRVYSTQDWSVVVALGTPSESSDDAVHSLDFSPGDGAWLAAGYKRAGVFAVFDVEHACVVRRFSLPDLLGASLGLLTRFAPSVSGDVLAIGGTTSKTLLLCQIEDAPVVTTSMPIDVEGKQVLAPALGGVAYAAGLVAMCAGSRLVVRTAGGAGTKGGTVLDVDLGDPIEATLAFRTPISLRSDGLQVAAITKTKGVSVRVVRTGRVAFTLGPYAGMREGASSQIWDACWSPDSRFFVVVA